jgi:molecular chaperone GrpE (heat shock protein)
MSTQTNPRIEKWPFFVGDAVMLALAWFLQMQLRMGRLEVAALFVCCIAGAVLSVTPYVLEHWAALHLGEAATLASTADQLRGLETVAGHVANATSQWQTVQEHCDKTVGAAKAIADRINAEAAAFTSFMQKTEESDRANLRVEIEKLRRTEAEWLQVAVRLLDHVHALHQAALRSGQPALIEQLGNFQNACREVVRRVGLVPFAPAAGDSFNPETHVLREGEQKPEPGARVGETIATGYTFQGQVVRAPLVSIRPEEPNGTRPPESAPEPAAAESNGEPASSAEPDTERTLL